MYEITYRDDEQGEEHQVSGETFKALATELEAQGYAGPSLRVYTEQGFTAGFVSAAERATS